jgi:acetyl esterase
MMPVLLNRVTAHVSSAWKPQLMPLARHPNRGGGPCKGPSAEPTRPGRLAGAATVPFTSRELATRQQETTVPIDPRFATRFPRLDGVTSLLAAMADPQQRAKLDAYQAWDDGYEPPLVEVADDEADGPHGPIPVRIYRPTSRGGVTTLRPALVWLHGGGWLAGDLEMPEADVVSRELAHRAGAVIISVGYRLATDGVTFPVPHDDVVAAYRWASRSAARLGVEPHLISLGGASAGANLACGAALHLRDDGDEPAPHQLLLAYPLVHPTVPPLSSEHEDAMGPVPPVLRFPAELVRLLVENYVGSPVEGFPNLSPYAFPAAGDLRELPPVTIITCEYDDLRPSGEAFADLLEDAGVSVRLIQEDGVLHGHLNEDPRIPQVDHTLSLFAGALTFAQATRRDKASSSASETMY